jgi:BclB C-terminal domain-containing protein
MSGQAGGAALVPFASGLPVELSDDPDAGRIGAVIGFGNSGASPDLLGGSIDLTNIIDMAWSMPTDGTLVQLSAMYSNVVAVVIPAGVKATVFVQLYRAPVGSNTFTPIGPTATLLPSFTGPLAVGGTATRSIPLGDIAVNAEDRLVLVALVELEGTTTALLPVLTGYISAGLKLVLA